MPLAVGQPAGRRYVRCRSSLARWTLQSACFRPTIPPAHHAQPVCCLKTCSGLNRPALASPAMRHDGLLHSAVSLPPLVGGPVRGALRLSLGAVRWSEAAPADLCQHTGDLGARLAWWGDGSGGDLVPLPPPADGSGEMAPACLSFELRTGPKYLTRYLKDMGALTITIEAAPSSASSGLGPAAAGAEGPVAAGAGAAPCPLAAATVGLLALDVHAPISGTYPLVLATATGSAVGAAPGSGGSGAGSGGDGSTPAIVGSLEVQVELDYSSSSGAAALVSSFELNEHLDSSAEEELDEGEEAAADDGASASDAGASSGSEAAPAAAPPGLCEQLVGALQDRWV